MVFSATLAHAVTDEMVYTPEATSFSLATGAKAQAVRVRVYDQGQGGKVARTLKLKRSADGEPLWTGSLKGDWQGRFYTFSVRYGGKWLPECAGVSAKAVGVNGCRGAIIDMRSTDPEGWQDDRRPAIAPQDLVIYEMHHRDFSIDESSGIVNKGKFLALTESRAISHLQRLGINAVHILPSFDYASVDETRPEDPQYNWGYDPLNYNVPEGSYATNAADPASRIREFKLMVQALHKAGIKVILDVVYNHTFNIDGSNFQRVNPDAYYRKTADGKYGNGSGCGNETASEREPMRSFIVNSMRYWADEYHIDGFRVDLMGVHDIATMNAVRKALPPEIFVYGEGWSAGSCVLPDEQLAMKAHIPQMPGIAAFSDDLRDALRGPFNDDRKGAFLAGAAGGEESVKAGIAGMISHPQIDYGKVNYSKRPWALQPTQMIAYVSCHDDMCLVDRLRVSIPGLTTAELISLDLLAQTAVMTSQGVPFMLSGEEMLRDKKGVHNSFESPDSVNRLDWNNLLRYPQVFSYYSNLIAMRKHHPAFHMGDAQLVHKHLRFLPSQPGFVAFMLTDNAGGDSWRNIIVAFNAGKTEKTFTVPQGSYTVVCANGVVSEQGLCTLTTGELTVGGQSALIVHD